LISPPPIQLNVMLSCAGRQVPLVQSFVHAIAGRGKVHVADLNPHAAALGPANVAMVSPRFTDPVYPDWCLDVCHEHGIGMWFSLLENDLAVLEGLRERMAEVGCLLVGAPLEAISIAMDKISYSRHLRQYGINVPDTRTLRQVLVAGGMTGDDFIVKMRRGRGSRGVLRVTGSHALVDAAKRLDDPDAWIAQAYVEGQIYCIDVINDLDRNFAACLIRKRLAMGARETDVAETISDARVEELALTLSKAMGHQGCMDVDLIESDGDLYVIDMNMRFGGSHIFSLVAGANIPATLVAWRLGQDPDPAWLRHRDGEILSRYSAAARMPVSF